MLLTLLVLVLLLGLAYWALHRVAGAFGLPAQIVVLLDVLLVVIGVITLIRTVGLRVPF